MICLILSLTEGDKGKPSKIQILKIAHTLENSILQRRRDVVISPQAAEVVNERGVELEKISKIIEVLDTKSELHDSDDSFNNLAWIR